MSDENSRPEVRLLGVAGSLRARSFNRALLRAAAELAPAGVGVESFDLRPVPLYDADIDRDGERPEAVERLKRAIGDADGLLLAGPEYNCGISGVLKNALDWASRPAFRSPLAGKPVGIMSAATGGVGGARGQEQLKLVLLGVTASVYPRIGLMVPRAAERFDDDLRLADEPTREHLAKYVAGLAEWTRRLTGP